MSLAHIESVVRNVFMDYKMLVSFSGLPSYNVKINIIKTYLQKDQLSKKFEFFSSSHPIIS